MCKYCDTKSYEELPEMHTTDGGFDGKIFDTCIDTDQFGLPYIMLPENYDIPIRFCPFCGRKLKWNIWRQNKLFKLL